MELVSKVMTAFSDGDVVIKVNNQVIGEVNIASFEEKANGKVTGEIEVISFANAPGEETGGIEVISFANAPGEELLEDLFSSKTRFNMEVYLRNEEGNVKQFEIKACKIKKRFKENVIKNSFITAVFYFTGKELVITRKGEN